MRTDPVGTIAEDDRVVAEGTAGATTVTGAACDNRRIGVRTVRDGRITSVVAYAGTQHVAETLFPGFPGREGGGVQPEGVTGGP